MIRHIVMWKFRPGTEAEQKAFLEGLRGLQGVIPQLFESLEALDAYKNDPRHKAVSALCKSIRTDRVAVDYEF